MKSSTNCLINDLENFSTLFKALSDPNRLRIFSYLCDCSSRGDDSVKVKEVASCCDVDLSVVSRHLSTLKNAGVLSAKKRGKEVFYSVKGSEVSKILRSLADFVDKCKCSKGENHE